jgi:hypothetical protein
MQRLYASLSVRGRLGFIFLIAIIVLGISAPAVGSTQPPGENPGSSPSSLFFPFIERDYSPPPPPSSFEQIDGAVEAGTIDAETAILYKTYAVFGDDRLPEAFRSTNVGGQGGLFMLEAAGAYETLSAGAQAILAPFFIPPYLEGSWSTQAEGSSHPSAPSAWAYLPAAGGKVRVWYKQADPELRRKAGVIANAVTNDIWPKETELMGREPVPDSAGVQNIVVFDHYRQGWESAFVPFGGYAGMAVPKTCAPTPSILYINPSLPDSASVRSQGTQVGLIETTAHEFMHALQFSFSLAVNPCTEYSWLGEATASWAEDFVYPDHDTEWRFAKYFLNLPYKALNNRTDWRDYGEYLLIYYFTHKYNNPYAVRTAWTAAETLDSLEAFYSLGGLSADQVASLYNKEPFGAFFKDHDTLPYSGFHLSRTLKPAGGFNEFSLVTGIPAGAIYIDHFTVDPSVRTLTILDGMTTKIIAGPYEGVGEDRIYNQEDPDPDTIRGAQTVTLIKVDGQDAWQTVNPGRQDFCLDWVKQRVTELLVIQTNQDLTDRNRELRTAGERTKILVSTAPCMSLHGAASKTITFDGVTETLAASGLEYVLTGFEPSFDPQYVNLLAPNIDMHLVKGEVSWSIQGADSDGCTYSGSDSFTLTEWSNPSQLTLYYDLLPGSRRFMGYEGTGSTDSPMPEVSYTVSCPDRPTQTFEEVVGYFFMPDGTIPVGGDGSLKGAATLDDGGQTILYEWNLSPGTR